jgi:glucose-1-phosphate thymidylyltransferase
LPLSEAISVRAIILAGGYGRRMRELTPGPKSLLPVGGGPAINYILDKLNETAPVKIILTTNLRFKPDFESWLAAKGSHNIELIVEESTCERDKLGAVGALGQLAPTLESDDYLVVCGDNIFKSSLVGMVGYYERRKRPVVAVYLQKTLKDVKLGSAVTLGHDNRVVSFEEKPSHPRTRLAGACIYLLPHASLLSTKRYLDEGGNRDEPGSFIAWLCREEEVYAYMLDSYLWDIGTPEGYVKLKKEFTEKAVTDVKRSSGRRSS